MSILAIGVMSGTSLDGVDIALCRFTESEDDWAYEIIDAQTVSYSNRWIEKLRNAHHLTAFEFLLLHNEYGIYVGKLIQEFLQGNSATNCFSRTYHFSSTRQKINLSTRKRSLNCCNHRNYNRK